MDLIGFVSEYITVGSSNLISAGKINFTDQSWKVWGTSMSSISLFKNQILQILVDAFLLALDIVGLNILDSIIPRARQCHWKYR